MVELNMRGIFASKYLKDNVFGTKFFGAAGDGCGPLHGHGNKCPKQYNAASKRDLAQAEAQKAWTNVGVSDVVGNDKMLNQLDAKSVKAILDDLLRPIEQRLPEMIADIDLQRTEERRKVLTRLLTKSRAGSDQAWKAIGSDQ